MTRVRMWAVVLVAALMLALPGNSCGPFFAEMVFVHAEAPDNLKAFLDGDLGVVQAGLSPRFLALAYRILSGPALTADERAMVLQASEPGLNNASLTDQGSGTTDAKSAWKAARAAIADSAGSVGDSSRKVPGQDWDTYANCLDDAYDHAARTLTARAREHGNGKAELADWVRGQDAVFSNCAANGEMPATVSEPEWLVQDRAYQVAAAHFYRAEFEEAEKKFEAIEADSNSPWHSLAGYLVGRCILRRATLAVPDKIDETLLRKADDQFQRVARIGGPYAAPAQEMLNFVELRVNPGSASARLGNAISLPDSRLQQHLVDLRYATNRAEWFSHMEDARSSDLMDWVLTMQGFPPQAHPADVDAQALHHATDRWRQSGNVAWLIAALSKMHTPDAELAQAAIAVKPSSSAWATLTYYRLQSLPVGETARAQVLLAREKMIAAHASATTVNLFTLLAREKAETLEQFAALAPMEPAGEIDDVYGPLPPATLVATGEKSSTMAGLPVNVQGDNRLDESTAELLNEHLPLDTLVQLVLESRWPKQLRFEFAMAVWTRAVLLNRPDAARKLTPLMLENEPGWKSWLHGYDSANSDNERMVTALLALMRFPSVRPYVNGGAGREEGFVGYSVYRDNWWCASMAEGGYNTANNYSAGYQDPNQAQKPAKKLPPFITPEMERVARQEHDALLKVGDAPAYFGNATLAWVRTHPDDSRNPEVLGFAFRAMRNGCNLEKSTTLRREVFNVLHKEYSGSEWAMRYQVFESPEG